MGNLDTTVTIHDAATLSTGMLNMADWGYTSATVNVKDNANLNANMVAMGQAGGLATINMSNNSHCNVSGFYSFSDGSNVTAVYGGLIVNLGGHSSNATLNIGDNAVINAGEVELCRDTWWGDFAPAAVVNVTGNARINTNTDNSATGDVNVGQGGNGVGFLNISGTSQVSAAHNVNVGFSGNASGYINVSGSGLLSAAEIDLSTASSYGAYNQQRQINISQNGQILVSGNVNQGQSSGTGGSPGLMNVADSGYLQVGGNYSLTNGTLTISATTGTPQVNVLGDMTAGVSGGSACNVTVSGNGTLRSAATYTLQTTAP